MQDRHTASTAQDLQTAGATLLYALRRYRVVVALAVLAAAAAGVLTSLAVAPSYEAVASLHLGDPRESTVFESTQTAVEPSRHARNQAALLTSDPVLEAAAPTVPLEELRDRVSAEASTSLDLIEVHALGNTPAEAAELANAVAGAYRDAVREDVAANAEAAVAEIREATASLQAQVEAAEAAAAAEPDNAALEASRDAAVAQLLTVQGRAEQITVDAALRGDGVELFQAAREPNAPVGPGPVLSGVAGALVGFLLAAAIAWLAADRNQRADHRGDPAAVLGAPLLGEVPAFEAADGAMTPTLSSPLSAAAEAYQFLVGSLDAALADTDGACVLVTSAGAGAGKTVTALNLAIAAACDGRRVVIVDGDDRARGLSEATGALDEPGLTDLGGDDDLADKALALPTGGGHALRVVPAGRPVTETAGFYRTTAFRRAMDVIRADAELVVVDSPPLLAVAETSAIASQVDGIVLVVDRGTRLHELVELKERLALVGTPLLGYVFNRDRERTDRYYPYGPAPASRAAAASRHQR